MNGLQNVPGRCTFLKNLQALEIFNTKTDFLNFKILFSISFLKFFSVSIHRNLNKLEANYEISELERFYVENPLANIR